MGTKPTSRKAVKKILGCLHQTVLHNHTRKIGNIADLSMIAQIEVDDDVMWLKAQLLIRITKLIIQPHDDALQQFKHIWIHCFLSQSG